MNGIQSCQYLDSFREKLIIVVLDQGLRKNIKEIIVNYNSKNITIIEYGCGTGNNI